MIKSIIIFLLLILMLVLETSCASKTFKVKSLDNEVSAFSKSVCKEKRMLNLETPFLPEIELPDTLYDFNFLDVSAREAFLEVSQTTGMTIVMDENVAGTITMIIKSKNLRDILTMMSSTGPLDFKIENGFVFVGLSDPKSPSWWRLIHHFQYRSRYVTPSVIVNALDPSLKNLVSVDDTSRIISIVAPRKIMNDILKVITILDQSQRQILLSLNVSEISSIGRENMGRLFQSKTLFNSSPNDFLTLSSSSRSTFNSSTPTVIFPPNLFSKYLASIAALEEKGYAETKAQPRIVISEGQKAVFASNRKQLLRTQGYIDSKVQFLEAGINLNITPFIANDDEILLNITDSSAADFDPQSEEVYEHKISTSVRVKTGDSILIGGMLKKTKQVTVTKVPYLSSLPAIGWFFKNETQNDDIREVIFTIRPEILCSN